MKYGIGVKIMNDPENAAYTLFIAMVVSVIVQFVLTLVMNIGISWYISVNPL